MAIDRLISSDSHVTVTHDQVKSHLASKFHEEYDAAVAEWEANLYGGMGAGRVNRAGATMYRHPAAGRPGNADAAERLKDMDTDGVDTEVLYCEVSAFRYLYLLKNGWKEATQAFNDALLEFAYTDPKRLVCSYQLPIHDIDHAVNEVKRVADAGGKSLQMPVFPAELGLPDYHDERYEPLLATIQETGLPICCHTGLNTSLNNLAVRDPTPQRGVMVLQVPLTTGEAFGMWIMGGVFERFPDLKLVFVETTLGWIPWYMYTADDLVQRQHYDFPRISEPPSHYFKKNIWLTFIDEPQAIRDDRYDIGVDRIMWSSDYPHPVSSWPNSRALAEEQLKDIPEEETVLITSLNAAHVWNL
jgi:predicted TIM-barrel fold metal-dependent hydrolase